MTIQQTATAVVGLVPTSEETIHTQITAGGVVILLNLAAMAATNELIVRHNVTFPDGPATITVGSKTIEHGVTTDDTWSATAGDTEADGWESWVFAFGDDGGTVTLESLSGSYDIEYTVLSVGGPTG